MTTHNPNYEDGPGPNGTALVVFILYMMIAAVLIWM